MLELLYVNSLPQVLLCVAFIFLWVFKHLKRTVKNKSYISKKKWKKNDWRQEEMKKMIGLSACLSIVLTIMLFFKEKGDSIEVNKERLPVVGVLQLTATPH